MITSASNNDDLMQRLNSIIDSQIGDDQKPFAKKDLHDFVTAFVAKIKHEQQSTNGTMNISKTMLRNTININVKRDTQNGNTAVLKTT